MPRPTIIAIASIMFASTGVCPLASQDAPYPSKPIRVIIPSSAGAGTDVAGRMVATAAERHLGQPFVVENRPGAGGRIGAAFVAKAPADGYTLLYSAKPTLTIHQYLSKPKPSFDAEKDFTPVSIMVRAPALLVVRSSFPARTVKEFVAYARKNPGKVTFGIQGVGNEFHVSLQMLREAADIKLIAIPYPGGAPAIVDLLGDRLDAMILVPAAITEHLASGKLVALATLEPKRAPDHPDVPTIAEAGLPQVSGSPWFGFVAPGATPPSAIRRLADAFAKLSADGELVSRLGKLGYTLSVEGPADFAAVLKKERREYSKFAAGGRLEKPN